MRALLLALFLLTMPLDAFADPSLAQPAFYSSAGRERVVSFQGNFRSELRALSELSKLSEEQKQQFGEQHIAPTMKFLFGPLTNRALASPQRGTGLLIHWEKARQAGGRVILPYEYRGVWIVLKDLPERFSLPVPLNKNLLLTSRWKNCTDSAPDHQTEWFYWYFWDPERYGCDHKQGTHFEMVTVQLGAQTKNEEASYPEYEKLFEGEGIDKSFQLTFAFGYVENVANPDPDKDRDSGMAEYRAFVKYVRTLLGSALIEKKIFQNEYRGGAELGPAIGRRFTGKLRGIQISISVVTAAGLDQMDLFAKSFAHDHDGFFGWFGHSRVGSGFDADSFRHMMNQRPEYYSVSSRYQIVYWGGCNSYSYYTLPFFEFKAQAAGGLDPNGTKGLDIIANGLPSYFHLNAENAATALRHMMNWEEKQSYQSLVNELEATAQENGINVLVAVLGDEDNQ